MTEVPALREEIKKEPQAYTSVCSPGLSDKLVLTGRHECGNPNRDERILFVRIRIIDHEWDLLLEDPSELTGLNPLFTGRPVSLRQWGGEELELLRGEWLAHGKALLS